MCNGCLGPGSFIGVRIALATGMGFCFGRSLPLMGFCSHAALAYSLPDIHFGLRAVLMKASGPWCYLSLYEMKSGRLCPRIDTQEITKEEVLKIVPKNALVISDILFTKEDLAANERQLVRMEGPTARGIELALGPQNLFIEGGWVFKDESQVIKPNYIRAPSVHKSIL